MIKSQGIACTSAEKGFVFSGSSINCINSIKLFPNSSINYVKLRLLDFFLFLLYLWLLNWIIVI